MTPSVFDPGLETITVASTELSEVDGENGDLVVRGYDIEDLAANATYEETLYLLLHDRLPDEDELADFRSTLGSRRHIGDAVRSVLERAADADDVDAMDALRMGLAAADLDGTSGDPVETAQRVVAVVPTIVATYERFRRGADPVGPDPDRGRAANYLHMLAGEDPTDAAVRALDALLVTAVDHGLNPSTFTARVVASTDSDLVSAATAAVGALKGPRHGGVLDPVFDVLRDAHAADDVEAFVRERVAERGSLRGFDHRLYQVRDPRAAVLAAAAERFTDQSSDDTFVDTVREFESVATDALAERDPDRRPEPTMVFYGAALTAAVGIPEHLYTATFGVARVGGWMAHCLEQRESETLIRPVAEYVGPTDRSWTPIDERPGGAGVGGAALEPVTETLSALSEPGRLETVLALHDAGTPVAYSTLRAATSIDDKGRFNYHLRRLREQGVVVSHDDGYALTDVGRSLVRALLDDGGLLADHFD